MKDLENKNMKIDRNINRNSKFDVLRIVDTFKNRLVNKILQGTQNRKYAKTAHSERGTGGATANSRKGSRTLLNAPPLDARRPIIIADKEFTKKYTHCCA